jgi:hypothetical protein
MARLRDIHVPVKTADHWQAYESTLQKRDEFGILYNLSSLKWLGRNKATLVYEDVSGMSGGTCDVSWDWWHHRWKVQTAMVWQY